MVINDPEELLRREALSGHERHFADLRAAVLGNLAVLATPPEGGQEQGPARAFRAGPWKRPWRWRRCVTLPETRA